MTGTRFLHRTFRPCRRTHKPSKENTHENHFNCCSLSTRPSVYGLWTERVPSFYPPAATGESACDSLSGLRQRVAFCRILLRRTGPWGAAFAFGILRAPCTDGVG